MNNQIKKDMSGFRKYRSYKRIRKDGFDQYKTVPYTRRLAVKYYCLECVGFVYSEVRNCTMPDCPLYPYRDGTLPEDKTAMDRNKSIRGFCLDCCGDDTKYVNECLKESPEKLCPLHPYRLSGYRTDKSSLIPAEDIENLPEYDRQFEYSEQKTAV